MSLISDRYPADRVSRAAVVEAVAPTARAVEAVLSELSDERVTRYSDAVGLQVGPDWQFAQLPGVRMSYDFWRSVVSGCATTLIRAYDHLGRASGAATSKAAARRALANLMLSRLPSCGYVAIRQNTVVNVAATPSRAAFPVVTARRMFMAAWRTGWQPTYAWRSDSGLVVLSLSGIGETVQVGPWAERLRDALLVSVSVSARGLPGRVPCAMLGYATESGRFVPRSLFRSSRFRSKTGWSDFREWLGSAAMFGLPAAAAYRESALLHPGCVAPRLSRGSLRLPTQFSRRYAQGRLGLVGYQGRRQRWSLFDIGLMCADMADSIPLVYRLGLWHRFLEVVHGQGFESGREKRPGRRRADGAEYEAGV